MPGQAGQGQQGCTQDQARRPDAGHRRISAPNGQFPLGE